MHISENTVYAVFASENWLTRDKFLALKKPAGNGLNKGGWHNANY